MEHIDPTTELGRLLVWCSGQKATDLHSQADRRYSIRLDGKLQRISAEQFSVPSNDDIMRMLRQGFSNSIYERIDKQHEMDLSFLCSQVRYRANFSKQQGKQSYSFRDSGCRQYHGGNASSRNGASGANHTACGFGAEGY